MDPGFSGLTQGLHVALQPHDLAPLIGLFQACLIALPQQIPALLLQHLGVCLPALTYQRNVWYVINAVWAS